MKEYNIVYQKTPDWSQIEKINVDFANWVENPGIKVEAQLAWNENELMYHGIAHEKDVRATFDAPGCEVCNDSCLEFFFMPEGDTRYINVESNPNCAIWLGIGTDMPDRIRLLLQDEKGILKMKANRTDDGWELFYSIPLSFMQMFYTGYEFKTGNVLKVNLMKCGDATPKLHWLSWEPFDPENKTFHDSKFFGKMTLVGGN